MNETGDKFLPQQIANPDQMHVVAYDFGIKSNILRMLTRENCRVTVVPAETPGRRSARHEPRRRLLSPTAPATPNRSTTPSKTCATWPARPRSFGICLGHQIFGLALGGKTYKLKFGHHGANHPIKNLDTGKVEITSQNHNYAVDPSTLD